MPDKGVPFRFLLLKLTDKKIAKESIGYGPNVWRNICTGPNGAQRNLSIRKNARPAERPRHRLRCRSLSSPRHLPFASAILPQSADRILIDAWEGDERPLPDAGAPRDATKAEVKTAFRARALRDHPDRHAGSSDAAARDAAARRFRQASDAYQILSDDRRRADYDLRLRSSSSSYARTSSSGWASSSSSASYGYGYGYGHEGGSWRRPPSGRGGSPAGSVDWEFVLKAVTRPGFLINVGFACVLLSGAAFLDGSILEIWKMNNSGKSFEDAMESIEKVKKDTEG